MGVVRAWYGRGLGGREAARRFDLLDTPRTPCPPPPLADRRSAPTALGPVSILELRTDGAGEAIEALLGDERVGVLVVLNDL